MTIRKNKNAGKKQFLWQCVFSCLQPCVLHSRILTAGQALIIPNTLHDYEDVWEFIRSKLDKLQIHEEKII
jgi:hypothetical protein